MPFAPSDSSGRKRPPASLHVPIRDHGVASGRPDGRQPLRPDPQAAWAGMKPEPPSTQPRRLPVADASSRVLTREARSVPDLSMVGRLSTIESPLSRIRTGFAAAGAGIVAAVAAVAATTAARADFRRMAGSRLGTLSTGPKVRPRPLRGRTAGPVPADGRYARLHWVDNQSTHGDDRLRRGRTRGRLRVEEPVGLVKKPAKTISADSHEYALAA